MVDLLRPEALSPAAQRDLEHRLRVHALFRLPALDGLPGVASVELAPTRTTTVVYHDTDDLRLFRWGITLMRREGGPHEGWQMRMPPVDEEPDDIDLPLEAAGIGDVPPSMADIATAFSRERDVRPVATLRTERTPYRLLDADGALVAELFDDTVSVLDGEHVAARFRELDVCGHPSNEPDDVPTAVLALLVEYGATPGTSSKVAHALGPRASSAPDVVERSGVGPADPAGDAVRAHLARHVRRFLLQDVRVRRDLPDSVHQMRVAARRLRSGLKTFAPLVDPEWSAHLRTELGWVAGELGLIRDTEVLLQRLDAHAEELSPADAQLAIVSINRILGAQLTRGRDEAMAALRSDRHRQLLVALVEAVHHPHLTEAATQPCTDILPPLVAKAYKKLARDVKGLHVDSPAEPWHQTRIEAKKARYAAEMVEPIFGASAKGLAGVFEEVTELLGEHQDCHVSQQTLRSIATEPDISGPAGFALGLLHAWEEEREISLRHDFGGLWPRVVKVFRHTKLA